MWVHRTLPIHIKEGKEMTLTAQEILGAYQLGLITPAEAREALGFKAAPLSEVKEDK